MRQRRDSRIILKATIKEFFQEVVTTAVRNQRLSTHDMAVTYLADVLSTFARAETLYDRERGIAERPLTFILGDAMEAPPDERIGIFRKLGDFCLFIAGFFSDSLNRKLVDVDYYIGMGEGAYANVAGLLRPKSGSGEFVDLFGELAHNFGSFVDIFAEVSEQGSFTTNQGTLRVYEKWLRTSSERLAQELRQRGILPIEAARSRLLQ